MEAFGVSLDENDVPFHVAVIMDGNGRWAKKMGKPRHEGHRNGSRKVLDIVDAAHKCGVKVLTVYAFSTENWKRSQEEVGFLMLLLEEFFKQEVSRLLREGVRIVQIGDINGLPKNIQSIVREAEERSKDNTKLVINVALNYGSKDEVKRALKNIALDVKEGKLSEENIDDDTLSRYLDTNEFADPELLIRTSGEFRLSNFLLHQLAYTEIYITDTLWPEFSKEEFALAIKSYQERDRRFGGRNDS